MLAPTEIHQKFPNTLIPERWRESSIHREAKKARHAAQKSALRLTELLLTYPRNRALQEAPSTYLPDGRTLDVRLINIEQVHSLNDLLRANRFTDRLEVNIRGEKGDQYGYSLFWRISQPLQISDYREYHRGDRVASASDNPFALEGHTARIWSLYVDFNPTRQRDVLTRCKEIFDIALTSLIAQQSSAHLP